MATDPAGRGALAQAQRVSAGGGGGDGFAGCADPFAAGLAMFEKPRKENVCEYPGPTLKYFLQTPINLHQRPGRGRDSPLIGSGRSA
ncbi:hypothetical protein EMIT047CA2_10034 [Pseudomonas soli]